MSWDGASSDGRDGLSRQQKEALETVSLTIDVDNIKVMPFPSIASFLVATPVLLCCFQMNNTLWTYMGNIG